MWPGTLFFVPGSCDLWTWSVLRISKTTAMSAEMSIAIYRLTEKSKFSVEFAVCPSIWSFIDLYTLHISILISHICNLCDSSCSQVQNYLFLLFSLVFMLRSMVINIDDLELNMVQRRLFVGINDNCIRWHESPTISMGQFVSAAVSGHSDDVAM